jgi:hypothetical protein
MPESKATVRLTLDGQRAIKETERVKRGVRGIGDEFQKAGAQLAKSVVGIMALAQAVDRAADAAKRIREEAAGANRERGSVALQRGAAGRTLKLSPRDLQAYQNIQETGAVDEQAQVSFMEALAKQGGRRVRGARGLEYAQAFATGAFTQDELLEMAKRGRRPDVAKRMSSLSPSELDEIDIRTEELDKTRRPAAGGREERRTLAELERQRRDSPVASTIAGMAEGVPVIGPVAAEIGARALEGRDRRNASINETMEEVAQAATLSNLLRSAQTINRNLGGAILRSFGVMDGPVDDRDLSEFKRRRAQRVEVVNKPVQYGIRGEGGP